MSLADSLRAIAERTTSNLRRDVRSRNGILFILGSLLLLPLPAVLGGYTLGILIQMLIFIVVVASWIFIAGYFGIFTFAHAALYGIGAYATAILAAEAGVPPLLAILLGGIVVVIFALPIAYPVLKLTGAYVAMVTLAYAEIIYHGTIIFRDVTGGPTGYTGIPRLFGDSAIAEAIGGPRIALFYFVFLFTLVSCLAMYAMLVNRFGLVARAIRESEDAAQMLGNNTPRYKLYGFLIGSAIAGMAGGLQAFNILLISPPMLELDRMIEFMAMGIIGGLRLLSGAVFGTIIVYGLQEYLRAFGDFRLLIWGVMLVVVILFVPNGFAGMSVRQKLRAIRERVLGAEDETGAPTSSSGDD